MKINNIIIENNNFNIEFIKKYEKIYESNLFDNYTKLLSLTIWLGNPCCFTCNDKKLTSLMIAYYLCEKYLSTI